MIEVDLRLERADFLLAVRFTIPHAGITALFGPSGCGKTSVLRAVAGLVRARGRVVLDDECWQDDAQGLFVPTHRRSIGYVVQESALFPHLTVRRNLAYGLRRRRRAAGESGVDLDALVELLDIGHLLDRWPATLSGGERQRVAIARALAPAPRLLLMDEPLAALDAARKAEILPYLENLHARLRTPVLYVSHAVDEVARLADDVLLMTDGRIEASGPVGEVLARAGSPVGGTGEAGVVLDALVAEHDASYGLTRIAFAGGALWVGRVDAAPGARVRARVLARDVSVAREAPRQTSILNILEVLLVEATVDGSTVVLRLRCTGPCQAAAAVPAWLLARITRRSFDELGLCDGQRLWAQVKGVSLMDAAGLR